MTDYNPSYALRLRGSRGFSCRIQSLRSARARSGDRGRSEAARNFRARHGGRGASARRTRRLRRDPQRRERARRGDRRRARARPGRAAILGPGRRRIPAALRRARREARSLRRPRDRARQCQARAFSRGRQAPPRLARRRGQRKIGGRAGPAAPLRARAPQARQASLGEALRAGDRARAERIPDLAAFECARRRRPVSPARRQRAPLLLSSRRQGEARGNAAQEPGVRCGAETGRRGRRERLCGEYRRWKVCGMPPPSSGGFAVLQILEILERFDLRALKADSVEAVHLFAEAGRLAYADRNLYIADPEFVAAPLAALLEPAYLASRAKLIDPLHSMGRARAGNPAGVSANLGLAQPLELSVTTHVSIVDTEGNAVALTASVEAAFGNRQMVRGFLLNNELTDFSWAPEEDGKPVANRVEAKKRPRSSMAPTMVFDEKGKLGMVIGSPGGHSIINYVALTLVNVLDWNLDIQKAIDAPRMGSS